MVDLTLRPMHPEEVVELVRITQATGFFHPQEVEVAQEVLSEAAQKGEASGYYVRVAAGHHRLLGYVCFGPTPLTRGTWDVYWIAVDPASQGQGVGHRLMGLAEGEICSRGGRLVLVETSSKDQYQPTRQFYRRLGYREVSCIADFYEVGDDQVVFGKVLSQGGDRTMTG